MIVEALLIGLVVGFLYYEFVGFSPGGVVAPGYVALFILHPTRIIMTVVISLVVVGIIRILAKHLLLYGRRRLLVALLLGFAIKIAVDRWIQPIPSVSIDLQSIGYIVPGLIANEMHRQRIMPTLASLGIVSVLVYLILLLIR